MTALLTILFVFALMPFLILYSAFSWGYVATILYTWFILPIFPNLHVFTWIQFAGISFFLNCFIHSYGGENIKKEYKDSNNHLTSTLLRPWLLLLAAWVFKIIIY